MSTDSDIIYNMLLADFLKADEEKTSDNIRSHSITLTLNGEKHQLCDAEYYEVMTKLTNQYAYIYFTMQMDDTELIQSQNQKSVREVLEENEAMIARYRQH